MLALSGFAQASVSVQDISFNSRPGSKFEIRLDFDGPPPEPKAYTIEKPARISMDFPGVASALDRKKFALPYGNATGVVVLESGGRTRMIVNLVKLVPYETRVDGNSLFIEVGNEGTNDYLKPVSDPLVLQPEAVATEDSASNIESLEFQRTEDGEGRLMLTLSDPSVDVNV
ncbi:MAG: AMIN domain-containing protein, partial [Planctomycetaceae bacterium]|nr:AMIN domain-containing protein [Planctomycetaceae bacterium]